MKEIFIVEDDDGIRELIEFLLVSEQYAVKTFPSAKAFNKIVPKETPDPFLLDIMLPDGNGLDLCNKLKKNNVTSDIPIVLMSAHADLNRTTCEADDFITKPFDVDELLKRIQQHLDTTGG
jgi:DNA-binding response OmpR family regulator